MPIISDGDRGSLVRRHSEQTVRDHERAWCFLLDATADAPFEKRLLGCKTLEEAWWIIIGWHMPATDSEKELLSHQLDNAKMTSDEDPKLFFARVDGMINTLRSAGITKEEREITRTIIRNLPDDYDVERRGVLMKPDITRVEVEEIVRTRHAAFYSGPNSYSRNQPRLHLTLDRNFRPLIPMHSLLVVGIEAVAVDSPAQDAPAALKHKAAARAGVISHSKPTCPLISPIIFNSNHDHHSDSNSSNNTTVSADNNCIVNGLRRNRGSV